MVEKDGRQRMKGNFRHSETMGEFRQRFFIPDDAELLMMGQPVHDTQHFGMFAQLMDMGFDCLEIEVRGNDYDDGSGGGGGKRAGSNGTKGQTMEQKQAAMKKKREEALQDDVRLQFLDAAKRGDAAVLKAIMASGKVDANVSVSGSQLRDLENVSALSLAAKGPKGGRGSGECVKLLLDAKARLDGMIIYSALQGRSEEACELIVKAGANVRNKDDSIGDHPLHTAIGKQLWPIVPLLLEKKADVAALDASKYTALALAIGKGHSDTVKALLKAKAIVDPGAVLAALGSEDSTIRDVVVQGKSLTTSNEEGQTALHVAALQKETELAKSLMELYAAQNLPSQEGLDKPDKNGMTPLMAACKSGGMRITCDLLRAGACVNKRDLEGNTPLHYTYGEDKTTFKTWHNTKIYTVLVSKAGADPEAVNDAGVKPKRVEDALEEEEADRAASENCKQQ